MRNTTSSLVHHPAPLQLGEVNALAFAAFDLSLTSQLQELETEHAFIANLSPADLPAVKQHAANS